MVVVKLNPSGNRWKKRSAISRLKTRRPELRSGMVLPVR